MGDDSDSPPPSKLLDHSDDSDDPIESCFTHAAYPAQVLLERKSDSDGDVTIVATPAAPPERIPIQEDSDGDEAGDDGADDAEFLAEFGPLLDEYRGKGPIDWTVVTEPIPEPPVEETRREVLRTVRVSPLLARLRADKRDELP
jgi:hypothetical protein